MFRLYVRSVKVKCLVIMFWCLLICMLGRWCMVVVGSCVVCGSCVLF